MDESAPAAVTPAVTVLPNFDRISAPEPKPRLTLLRRRTAETETHLPDASAGEPDHVEPGTDESAAPTATEPETGTVPLAVVPDSPAALVVVPAQATPAALTTSPEPSVTELQAALGRERQRADAAEAANAVLRRKLAAQDDELAGFRPRALVPFEDNTN